MRGAAGHVPVPLAQGGAMLVGADTGASVTPAHAAP
jgi:hypothetical protein